MDVKVEEEWKMFEGTSDKPILSDFRIKICLEF